ncbi:hypothetical protein [Limnobacter thiooxidans]|uniref:hypothetical protein n=1 Tax=Limnobacter thiooxidans TaxID=131080 RepID=UPI00102DA0A3
MKNIIFRIEYQVAICLNGSLDSINVFPMSRFLQDVYGVDRLNQAVAVLGGATSPSYEAVSLHNDIGSLESALGLPLTGLESVNESHPNSSDLDAAFSNEKSIVEVASTQVRSGNMLNGLVDEPTGFGPGLLRQVPLDAELMTRFQTSDADNSALSGTQSNDTRGALDVGSEPAASSNSTNSMASFLEQLLAKVEAASSDVSTELDGSTQGAVRELVLELGSELSRSVRAELQDNVAGVGRELASQVIDRTGVDPLSSVTEPLLAIDYYGEFATLINGTLDSIGQPIGSISLPQIGPFVGDLKSELAGLAV